MVDLTHLFRYNDINVLIYALLKAAFVTWLTSFGLQKLYLGC
jgi:hypothetical protein